MSSYADRQSFVFCEGGQDAAIVAAMVKPCLAEELFKSGQFEILIRIRGHARHRARFRAGLTALALSGSCKREKPLVPKPLVPILRYAILRTGRLTVLLSRRIDCGIFLTSGIRIQLSLLRRRDFDGAGLVRRPPDLR